MTVTQHGDPPPLRFAFRAKAVGLSRIRVTSWLGGTFLAELQLEVSVEPKKPTADSQRRSTPIGELQADPGEVTLQVHSYCFGGIHSSCSPRDTCSAPSSPNPLPRNRARQSNVPWQCCARWLPEHPGIPPT